jgi:hypothetical protein
MFYHFSLLICLSDSRMHDIREHVYCDSRKVDRRRRFDGEFPAKEGKLSRILHAGKFGRSESVPPELSWGITEAS